MNSTANTTEQTNYFISLIHKIEGIYNMVPDNNATLTYWLHSIAYIFANFYRCRPGCVQVCHSFKNPKKVI